MEEFSRQCEFKIVSEEERPFRKFRTTGHEITVPLNPQFVVRDPEAIIQDLINFCFTRALNNKADNAQVGLMIHNNNPDSSPIHIVWRGKRSIYGNVAFQSISNVLNSNETFFFNRDITFKTHVVDPVEGTGYYRCRCDRLALGKQKDINSKHNKIVH